MPFTVRSAGDTNDADAAAADAQQQQQRRVLILHRPLLPPTLSMRERANAYYARAVPALLSVAAAASFEGDDTEEEDDDPAVALEAWQLAQLRLVVATDRVRLQHPPATATEGAGQEEEEQEVVLDVEVDYALEWSEEDEGSQNADTVRHLLLALFGATAAPCLAKVDAKHSRLSRITPRDAPAQQAALGRAAQATRNPAYVSEVVGRLSRILGVMLGQPPGRYVARQEPAAAPAEMEQGGGGSMTVYLHMPELEAASSKGASGASESSSQVLDLHALIDASGQADASARSAWRKWLWPSSGTDHIPGTFVPRAE